MRMDRWTSDIVRFMNDASANTSYFASVADEVCRGVPSGGRICDAGCGMGQLSREMAVRGMKVDAVDISADALAHAEDAKAAGARLFCGEYADRARAAEPYDRMVFCLSASVEDAFAAACVNRASSLVVVNKAHARLDADCTRIASDGRALPSGFGRPAVYDLKADLCALADAGIVCNARERTFEFGQPLRSLEDARRYFSLFRTRCYPEGVTDEELESMLQRRRNDEFPYYLPVFRRLVFFDVDMAASIPLRHDGAFADAAACRCSEIRRIA